MTTQTPPLAQPPDLGGSQGYSWGGMTVPKSLWDAVRSAAAGTNVSVPGVQGSSRGQVPPALLLSLVEHENASYFTATPDPGNHIPDSDPATAYNGVYDVWGPLQLAKWSHPGYTREQLSDPSTNLAIGAKTIEANAKSILATNPTIDSNELWAEAIGGQNWNDVNKANPWQAAPYAIATFKQYPTLTGQAGTDAALPLTPPTPVPGGQADTGPFAGIASAINGIGASFTQFQQDLQLWGFKLVIGLVGVGFVLAGLWQLPQVRSTVGKGLKAASL